MYTYTHYTCNIFRRSTPRVIINGRRVCMIATLPTRRELKKPADGKKKRFRRNFFFSFFFMPFTTCDIYSAARDVHVPPCDVKNEMWDNKNNVYNVSLTVNRLHQTDSHLMSLMRFPPGNRSMMWELLCVCSGGGSLWNDTIQNNILYMFAVYRKRYWSRGSIKYSHIHAFIALRDTYIFIHIIYILYTTLLSLPVRGKTILYCFNMQSIRSLLHYLFFYQVIVVHLQLPNNIYTIWVYSSLYHNLWSCIIFPVSVLSYHVWLFIRTWNTI